jgi:glycosyltransferase involved in cell wall biosynthesis
VYTLHDLSFLVDASWSTEINRTACLQGAKRAADEADWIAAVSKSSREHYLRVFPHFPADRIEVIHPCSRFSRIISEGTPPAAVGNLAPGGYWLSVGTIEPRKNQRRIAEGYARYLARGGTPMPLVFAGGHGWLMDDFRRHLQSLGIHAKVIIAGYVSDEELIWLYRNCRAHIYLSHFEGFGLPVLEGMQFGAPTIASDSSSIPEVAGDAAVLLPPLDTEGLARNMLRLDRSPGDRAHLAAAARAQAARFDWRTSAAALLALYDRAVAAPKRRPGRPIQAAHF